LLVYARSGQFRTLYFHASHHLCHTHLSFCLDHLTPSHTFHTWVCTCTSLSPHLTCLPRSLHILGSAHSRSLRSRAYSWTHFLPSFCHSRLDAIFLLACTACMPASFCTACLLLFHAHTGPHFFLSFLDLTQPSSSSACTAFLGHRTLRLPPSHLIHNTHIYYTHSSFGYTYSPVHRTSVLTSLDTASSLWMPLYCTQTSAFSPRLLCGLPVSGHIHPHWTDTLPSWTSGPGPHTLSSTFGTFLFHTHRTHSLQFDFPVPCTTLCLTPFCLTFSPLRRYTPHAYTHLCTPHFGHTTTCSLPDLWTQGCLSFCSPTACILHFSLLFHTHTPSRSHIHYTPSCTHLPPFLCILPLCLTFSFSLLHTWVRTRHVSLVTTWFTVHGLPSHCLDRHFTLPLPFCLHATLATDRIATGCATLLPRCMPFWVTPFPSLRFMISAVHHPDLALDCLVPSMPLTWLDVRHCTLCTTFLYTCSGPDSGRHFTFLGPFSLLHHLTV